jgi:serine protease AprX
MAMHSLHRSSCRVLRLSAAIAALLCTATAASAAPSVDTTGSVAASASSSAAAWSTKVDPSVLARAALGETEFMVYLAQQADLSGAAALSTKDAKGRYVYERLTATAAATQPAVIATLANFGAPHNAFWISNTIWAKGNLALVQALASRTDVAAIHAVGRGALELPPQDAARDDAKLVTAVEPGIERTRADQVWSLGHEGEGVIVAGADTGVRFTHNALREHYRGWGGSAAASTHDYNWHDAIHIPNWPPEPLNACNPGGPTGLGQPSPTPCDDDELLGGGHGSHTMGSMLGWDGGANHIGMAPKAKFIACRNMSNGVGAVPSYLECMQWFLAPTKVDGTAPDPSKSPHVINNSWGCVEGCPPEPNPLRDALIASRAAGIVYVASAGNDGDTCNTIVSPLARYPEAFTVGSTTHTTDLVSDFSSRGPSAADPNNLESPLYTKPNISAPGSNIRSSLRGSDTEYGSLSGTSMSGPHVAGLVALIISANPDLAGNVDRIEDIIESTAAPKTTAEGCGGDSGTQVPNNTYGAGRIDALAAVTMALAEPPSGDIFANGFE